MADASPQNFNLKSILLGIVCIVVANLLVVALREFVGLPGSTSLQSGLATVVGVLAWFFIGARIKG